MLFGSPGKRQAEEQGMWHNPWGQLRHSVATVSAHILGQAAWPAFIQQYWWRGYSHTSNRTERRDSPTLDLAQILYLTLSHMWCRLFDGITYTCPLHEDHGMA